MELKDKTDFVLTNQSFVRGHKPLFIIINYMKLYGNNPSIHLLNSSEVTGMLSHSQAKVKYTLNGFSVICRAYGWLKSYIWPTNLKQVLVHAGTYCSFSVMLRNSEFDCYVMNIRFIFGIYICLMAGTKHLETDCSVGVENLSKWLKTETLKSFL